MHDTAIINGLLSNYKQRVPFEKEFYLQYEYFIQEGCRKYHLTYEDSFSAYSDAVLAAINNIINNRFDNKFSLKTYLFQIFNNKCVDFIRKNSNNKQQVHNSTVTPELLTHLPDTVKSAIEKLIDQEKISAVTGYVDAIDEKCKEILLLSAEGYTDKEIAEKLAYNNAAVAKTSRLRCREKINKLFTNHE
ncbi:MAG: sigma-70 family RNA polymerase sigma factor [Segetibacter sp.]